MEARTVQAIICARLQQTDSKIDLTSASYMNYVSLGSGSIAASGILETEYKEGMTFDEATALATKAISAGIIEDLGSGSQVDYCQISRTQYKMTRGALVIGKREGIKLEYDLSKKKVEYLKQFKHIFEKKEAKVIKGDVSAMDIEYVAAK